MAERPAKQRRRGRGGAVTFETVRELLGALPAVEEGTSYGTPGFRVRGKFLARLREDDDPTLVVPTDFQTRELLLEVDPEAFSITDHYRDSPMVLVRLRAVHRDELRTLLEDAWRARASKRLIAQYDAALDGRPADRRR